MQSRNLSRSLAESWLWHQRMVMAQTFSMIGMFAPLFRVKNWIWPDSWVTLTCFLVFFNSQPWKEFRYIDDDIGICLLQEVGKRMECSDGNDQILWPGCPHFVPYMPLGVIVPFLWLISYYIYIYLSLSLVSFIWLVRFDPIRWYWTFAAWMMTSVGTWRVRTVRSCL